MEHVYGHRGEEAAENELILLFPCQKGSGKPEPLAVSVAETSLCGEGHTVEPSTKEKTP